MGVQILTSRHHHLVTSLTDLLARHALRVTLVVALSIAAALATAALIGPRYTASLRVLVSPAAAGAAAIAPTDEAALIVQDHGQTARNQAELLRDPGLIRRLAPSLHQLRGAAVPQGGLRDTWQALAERLGLAPAADPQEAFAARITQALTVTAVGDTDVVRLDFTWADRHFAADALNLLLSGYQHAVAETAGARDALGRARTELADAQAEAAGAAAKVDTAEDAVAGLGSAQAIRTALDQARATADGLRLDRELARRKLDATDQAFKSGGWVDGPGAAGAFAKSFTALLGKRQEAAQAAQADAGAVRKIDAQIKQLREQNYRAVRRAYGAELATLDARLAAGAATVAGLEAKQRELDASRSELAVLSQARTAAAARLTEARRRAEQLQARIDTAWQEVSGTRVLSTVRPPAEPNWPSPALLLEVGVLGGLLAGVASAVLAERARPTIDRPADIARHLGVEVLARLEEMPMAQTL